MNRLTVRNEICSEPENAICYINPNDPEGMYNILDLAECLYDGGEAEAGILMEISSRLAEYEDTGLSPEEVAELAKAEGRLYTRHDVAVILAEFMGDNCACNFNGIDELLPKYCELLKSCPDVVGVACWEQYLKHRNKLTAEQSSVVERRDDIDSD
jgi:hypothetical protein